MGPARIPENLFLELMRLANEEVQFSFNDMMYVQTYGVAMCIWALFWPISSYAIMSDFSLTESIKPKFFDSRQ